MSDYVYYDTEYVPDPFGLNNTGVICWLNSLLQVLLSCSALNKVLLECEAEFKGNEFAREYIRLVRAIVPNRPEDEPIDPAKFGHASANILNAFMKQLRSKNLAFAIGASQECADEAFTLFVDLFDHPKVSKLFSNVYELSITCKNCGDVVSSMRDKTYKINLFCQKKLDTQDIFCQYIRVHPSELDYYKCEKCEQVMTRSHRIEKLKMLREIVVITFNKFHSKDNRWFPESLVFNAKGGGALHYRLIGQIEHGGNMYSGHYYANALRGNKFKRFNDSFVGDAATGPTPLTYMVVYHIVDAEEPKPDNKTE